MRNLTKIGVGVLTALAVAAPVTAAEAATTPSATHHKRQWTVVETLGNGKQDACKVSVDHKRGWRIVNRLDARSVTAGKLHANVTVLHDGKVTKRRRASGPVRPGHVSRVGSLVLPRKPGYTLQMSIASAGTGTGGPLAVADIGHC